MGIAERLRISSSFTIWFDSILLTLYWLICALIVQPFGNFPLNDDWSYAIAVQRWMESGTFLPTMWTSMTLVIQVFWGVLFCKIFGFSFDTLRFSSWTAGLLGILLVHHCCYQFSRNRLLSMSGALTLAINPLYFNLSLTFMTDVPFLSLSLITACCMMQFLKEKSEGFLVLAAITSAMSVLLRQNGLFLPIAFCITLLLIHPFSFETVIRSIFPLIVSWGTLKQFEMWLSKTGRTPYLYGLQVNAFGEVLDQLRSSFVRTAEWMISNIWSQILELGTFLLPLTLWAVYRHYTDQTPTAKYRTTGIMLIILGLTTGFLTILQGKTFPFMPNILHEGGVGPLTLHDRYILGMPNYPSLPRWLWQALTLCSGCGLVMLLWMLFQIGRNVIENIHRSIESSDALLIFLSLCFLVYMTPLVFIQSFDRYLILPIAFLCILSCKVGASPILEYKRRFNNFITVICTSVLLFWGWYGITGTHDYFSWNRLRWQMIHEVTDSGIPLSKIDGGFEVNGYAFHDHKYDRTQTAILKKAALSDHRRSWWWIQEDEYLLTFGMIPNSQIQRCETFDKWLPMTKGKLCLLKRSKG